MSQDILNPIRHIIRTNTLMPEDASVSYLLANNPLQDDVRATVEMTALEHVEQCRQNPDKQSLFDAFLQEYSLSSQEGVVLMCLAEALLRVPDSYTIDKLIAEKIHLGEWGQHIGKSNDLLVNAASAGLKLTDKILGKEQEYDGSPKGWFRSLINRVGEPVVRGATLQAMKFMGQQYVLGRDIKEAAKRGRKNNPRGTSFSFDMLGEGARTYADAQKYFEGYLGAIRTIGQHNKDSDVYAADGISVKLSALHPRYEFSQHHKVLSELLPSVLKLAIEAKRCNIGFTIDAEEAARLDIELDVFEALAFAPELADWDGLGFVLQAYQKRAVFVIDWLIALARESQRKLMVRLVKGAYWDAEIKHAQEMGLDEFPVFTRKVNTDLSYQVCAGKLLGNSQHIYPQFATHNAYTVTLIMALAGEGNTHYEFQRLHGMGELLYGQVAKSTGKAMPLRVYAPVGVHRDLLPYLVRRLLENGANGSFVNQFLDGKVPAASLVKSVESTLEALPGKRNSKIPLADDIFNAFGESRANSKGLDLDDPLIAEKLLHEVKELLTKPWQAGPIINGQMRTEQGKPVYSPADTNFVVGHCADVTCEEVDRALSAASAAQASWQQVGAVKRAEILDNIADLLEQQTPALTALISFEAGRTLGDGVSEVREAVDFCRYYALQIRQLVEQYPQQVLLKEGKGVFVCISPWNFPLAIFVGQVVAALAAGNAVIAKPAEQSPLIAAHAVKLMHQAGVPVEVLHLLTGIGREVGPILMADPRVAGVAFTGSTETAQLIQADLIKRGTTMPPFIAETGGQNVMIVDSTALPEQVIDDVIQSAFLSAGQRCSALRVLYVQEDIADNILNMLQGAIDALDVGKPWELKTDVGPVIDQTALQTLLAHCERMDKEAKIITKGVSGEICKTGHYFAPRVYELDNISQLKREVFGPILHVIRFKASQLSQVLADVNNTGYGLTLGIHSRIKHFADKVFAETRVGNTYINRNMVGAVVGVNPFGGHGLSGTGFKAGGPHYLLRFTNLWHSSAIQGDVMPPTSLGQEIQHRLLVANAVQVKWDRNRGDGRASILSKVLDTLVTSPLFADSVQPNLVAHQLLLKEAVEKFSAAIELPGPTGESNDLSLHGRGVFLICVSEHNIPLMLQQMMAALAAGNAVMLVAKEPSVQQPMEALIELLSALLPPGLIVGADNSGELAGLILSKEIAGLASQDVIGIVALMGQRKGAIVPLVTQCLTEFALLPYAVEKTKTNNIVATGGNAMLLNLQEN